LLGWGRGGGAFGLWELYGVGVVLNADADVVGGDQTVVMTDPLDVVMQTRNLG
jgi:hypothetical protein